MVRTGVDEEIWRWQVNFYFSFSSLAMERYVGSR